MKSMIVALSCASLFAISCSKDDDNSTNGPSLKTPNLDLVAPGGFKNTAKSGAEVGEKLKSASTSVASTSFSTKNSPRPGSALNGDILTLNSVQSFLAGDSDGAGSATSGPIRLPSSNRENGGFNLSDGSSCAQQLSQLNGIYSSGASALTQAADILKQFDGELPEGVSRGAATEQYAVTYNIDLSKIEVNNGQEAQSKAQISGTGLIGAGSNESSAVLSVGTNASISDKESTVAFNAGFAAAVHTKQQLLKLSADGDINMRGKDQPDLRGTFKTSVDLTAGETPSIAFKMNSSGNALIDENQAVRGDTKDHTVSLDITIAKVAQSQDIGITYAVTQDAKEQKGTITLTTDKYGRCVVKNPQAAAAR